MPPSEFHYRLRAIGFALIYSKVRHLAFNHLAWWDQMEIVIRSVRRNPYLGLKMHEIRIAKLAGFELLVVTI